MKKSAFDIYAGLTAALLSPLSLWLWIRTYPENKILALAAWGIPAIQGYVVPMVGANILRVWEWRAAGQWQRIRIHHGLVFGGATSLLAWGVRPGPVSSLGEALGLGVFLMMVLASVNFVYDVLAIRSGVLVVRNEPWARGESPSKIVGDYAPWFFGGFGFIYGTGLGILEFAPKAPFFRTIICFGIATAGILVPFIGYRWRSKIKFGHSGCHPVERRIQ